MFIIMCINIISVKKVSLLLHSLVCSPKDNVRRYFFEELLYIMHDARNQNKKYFFEIKEYINSSLFTTGKVANA
jgi:hypothetical protein